jgi:5-methyltetrahydropteroyltriglutamate--homocysteine methyltransferase
VRALVARREELSLPVVGDGQMRRESFHSELTAACNGFTRVDVNAWLWGAWHSSEAGDVTIARPAGLAMIAPLRKRRNLAAGRDVLRLHRGETTCAGWPATGVGSLCRNSVR